MIANVLSIAGSDPSGGAGIQADLKTFTALGCYGMAALTSLTVQNTLEVREVFHLESSFVEAQIRAIFDDIEVDALKIGMVGNARTITMLAGLLEDLKPRFVVLDPVMVATSGDPLISGHAVDVMKDKLIPLCDVLTPNIPEAEKLSGYALSVSEEMEVLAEKVCDLGCKAVLLKGGHAFGDSKATDVLFTDGRVKTFSVPRIETHNTHGTGCTLSAALTCFIGKGFALPEAAAKAKAYLTDALKASDALNVGKGHGPVNHFQFHGREEHEDA
ncbi:MAG: bifunctional hydroxymethylpyrimidine kinase/phosphomethylpyrimidine kinase [Alphaproteobacteria bacterium]|nr:bifunctional hydroxymethylpyrimidine kinase/phosphomethylpyrimidine kinase [Alphaproteobacteria bacterium]MCB1838634.1 bifunctional hydroxymethylpyrimidine kinase/phosphomethylpyrimidine kinase [Alphaproteobacteria bacterium]